MASSKKQPLNERSFLSEAANIIHSLRIPPQEKNTEADANLYVSIPNYSRKNPAVSTEASTTNPDELSSRVVSALSILASSEPSQQSAHITTKQFFISTQSACTEYLDWLVDKGQISRNLSQGFFSWIRHSTFGNSGKKRAEIIQNWSSANPDGLINYIETIFHKHAWNTHSLNSYLADHISELLEKGKLSHYTEQEKQSLIDLLKTKLEVSHTAPTLS